MRGGGENGMLGCEGKRLGCVGLDRQGGWQRDKGGGGGGRKSVGCRGVEGKEWYVGVWREMSGMWVCGGK